MDKSIDAMDLYQGQELLQSDGARASAISPEY
jgi:hypothetical protein